jgi:hypothetical protein
MQSTSDDQPSRSITFLSNTHGVDWRIELLAALEGGDDAHAVDRRFFDSILSHEGLSYAQLKALILDDRFDWLLLLVTDQNNGPKRVMLPYLMSKIRFKRHLDYDPLIDQALRQRYTADEIAVLFSSAECFAGMIGSMGSTIDERNIAMERVACIILEDPQTLDAWVTLMMKKLKNRFSLLGDAISFGKRLHEVARITPAYEALGSLGETHALEHHATMLTLMSVSSFISVFEPEKIKASLGRYTSATMYQLSASEITGQLDMRGNVVHRAFIQGLFLNAPDAQPFARIHLKNDPLQRGDIVICGALLACAPYMKRQPYSIRSLLAVRDGSSSAFDSFVENHLFSWRDELIDRIFSNPKMRSLRAKMLDLPTAVDIFERVMWSASLPRSLAEDAKGLYVRLPEKVRRHIHDLLVQRLSRSMSSSDLETRGSALSLLANLNTEAQKNQMRQIVLPTMKVIMQRATHQPGDPYKGLKFGVWQLMESLADMHTNGVLILSDFGPHIKTSKALSELAKTLAVDPARLIEHVKSSVQAECLEADLGL